MAGTTSGGEEPWVKPFYLNKKDIEHQKALYRDLSHTVNLIKFDVAGLAAGLTLVKIDFTLFKVDEKGITFRGKQLATFPWADKKKSLEERIERIAQRNNERQKKLEKDIERLKSVKGDVDEKRRQALNSGNKSDVYRIRIEISSLVDKAERIEKAIERRVSRITGRADKIDTLETKLKEIENKKKKAKEAREKIKEQSLAAQRDIQQMNREVRSAQQQVRRLSQTL